MSERAQDRAGFYKCESKRLQGEFGLCGFSTFCSSSTSPFSPWKGLCSPAPAQSSITVSHGSRSERLGLGCKLWRDTARWPPPASFISPAHAWQNEIGNTVRASLRELCFLCQRLCILSRIRQPRGQVERGWVTREGVHLLDELCVGWMGDQVMEIMRGYTLIQLWLEGEEIRWIKGVLADCQLIHERAQTHTCWKLDVKIFFFWGGRGGQDEEGQIQVIITCGRDCGNSCWFLDIPENGSINRHLRSRA